MPRPRLRKYSPDAKPIWEIAEEIAAEVPDSEWRKLPRDLAENFHHYRHGAPKEPAAKHGAGGNRCQSRHFGRP